MDRPGKFAARLIPTALIAASAGLCIAQPQPQRSRPECFVTEFGADPTGKSDSTKAFQTAVEQCSTGSGGRCRVRVAAGTYLITSHVSIRQDRVIIQGDGKQISIIRFEPVGPDSAFIFDKGNGSAIFQSGLTGLGFSGSNAQKKTGAMVITCSDCTWSDLAFYPWTGYTAAEGAVNVNGAAVTWVSGTPFERSMRYLNIAGANYLVSAVNSPTSITLASSAGSSMNGQRYTSTTSGSRPFEIHGHDMGNFQNISSTSDDGWFIGTDPATATISLDHHNFHNIYTVTGPDNACWTIDTGAYLTQDSWDGYQPQVQCQYGVFWNDSTSAGVSNGLNFANWRWEQGNPLIGTVDTDGALVTLKSAVRFTNNAADSFHPQDQLKTITINGSLYMVAAVVDATHLYLRTGAGVRKNAAFNTTGYAFDMSHNSGLQNVSIRNAQGGMSRGDQTDHNGIFFRNTRWLSIENVTYAGGPASIGLDLASNSNRSIFLSNLALAHGAAVNLKDAQHMNGCFEKLGAVSCFTPAGYENPSVTIPSNGTFDLGSDAVTGLLTITEYGTGAVCTIALDGRFHRTAVTADPFSGCSSSGDAPNKLSVYWKDTRYELRNALAGAALVTLTLNGHGDHQ